MGPDADAPHLGLTSAAASFNSEFLPWINAGRQGQAVTDAILAFLK